jgi:hypothetical protein
MSGADSVGPDGLQGAIELRVDVPNAVPDNTQIRLAVAVEIEQHGDVPGRPERDGQVDGAIAIGVDVPDAVPEDRKVGDAIAVDVARERYVTANASQAERHSQRAVLRGADVPRAVAVDHEVVASVAIEVG